MGVIQNIRASRLFHRVMRVLQFLSAIVSLGLFSARLAKILTLTKHASHSNGAVEGILVAAVLYSITVMILTFLRKHTDSKIARWALIVADLLFMGAFIAVAYLTRPHGGSSGPCNHSKFRAVIPKGQNCNLPWGTFILGSLSTLLHFFTAVLYEARDHNKVSKADREYHTGTNSAVNERYTGTSPAIHERY